MENALYGADLAQVHHEHFGGGAQALAGAGFAVERLDAYDDLEPVPGWSVFAATRGS